MADVRPFKGIHYSKSKIKDWSAVICPPHDIVNPQLQEELYKASEYNFVRLEFGRDQPNTENDNRYTRAAATLAQWLERGVLEADPSPAYYLHDHHFNYQHKKYTRRNLIARGLVQARRYNWMDTARKVVALYEEVAAGSQRRN